MKTYYGLVYVFLEDGTSVKYINTIFASKKPENSFKRTEIGDMWIEWFECRKEAEEHISN